MPPLPTGTLGNPWIITTNPGMVDVFVGHLTNDAPNTMGVITGFVFGDPIVGVFNDPSQTFTFARSTPPNPGFSQMYIGTLSIVSTDTSYPQKGTTTTTTNYQLQGNFFQAPSDEYGWIATISVAVSVYKSELSDLKLKRESKDHKDLKLENKENKDRTPEYLPGTVDPYLQPADLSTVLDRMMLRLDAIEQQLATGRSFIAPTDRPGVGQQALDAPSSADDKKNT
jgi:hypothetical protein